MQESIVILISIFVFIFAVWKVYKLFRDLDSVNIQDYECYKENTKEKKFKNNKF